MSGGDEWQDRRRGDAEWRREIADTLKRMDGRLAALEAKGQEQAARRQYVREFFEDFGRWFGYLSKLLASAAVVGGALYALIKWVATNG